LRSNDFREKRGGHGWTPIKSIENLQSLCRSKYLVSNWGRVKSWTPIHRGGARCCVGSERKRHFRAARERNSASRRQTRGPDGRSIVVHSRNASSFWNRGEELSDRLKKRPRLGARGAQTDERSSIIRGPTLMPLHATVFDEAFIMRVLEAALDRDAYSTMVHAVAAATARG
jgi:hypothetical protein